MARRPSRNDRNDPDAPHSPGHPHSSGAPDLIGRADELAALLDVLENGPALVVIEGEAGIGKTRLIREAVASMVNTPEVSVEFVSRGATGRAVLAAHAGSGWASLRASGADHSGNTFRQTVIRAYPIG